MSTLVMLEGKEVWNREGGKGKMLVVVVEGRWRGVVERKDEVKKR